MKFEKKHWEQCKTDNQNQILQSMMMMELAEKAVAHAEMRIAEFPEDKKA